jgi:glyoxylase-like metal-dependent hydrolase (beta-lactamase superfamily II)/rhodanese-related sulfurtransferase
MYFKQFYLGCLAHASYLIGSQGEAVVVDPQRDVDQYIAEAEAQGLRIKYVIETHLHADFVSGHRELAARTGAEIVFGKEADATFPHRAVRDGDEIRIGKVVLRIMETPGHTPESISVLVSEAETGEEGKRATGKAVVQTKEADRMSALPASRLKILTGDTLFVGDVGRPDLAGGKGYTPPMMAAMMYDTLREKILKLPNETEVYPAHGAGSMCGRNLSQETFSTIGEQRKSNYALQPMSKDEFVRMMTVDLPEAPAYFPRDAEINRTGAPSLAEVSRPAALTAEEVKKLADEAKESAAAGLQILDVRGAAEFGAGHLPGAINIGLSGQFAIWAGTLLAMDRPIVIVAESEEQAAEAVVRLARVGIESVKGYLAGGVAAWSEAGFELDSVPQITVYELNELIMGEAPLQIIDVRRPPEYVSGHVPGAQAAPLLSLRESVENLARKLDPNKPTAVICAGGYRSSAATGILARHGFSNLLNVTGGTSAWIAAGFETRKS